MKFGFFEEPVFDIECLLLREGGVFIDRFRAAHDFDGAVIELGGDAGFADG